MQSSLGLSQAKGGPKEVAIPSHLFADQTKKRSCCLIVVWCSVNVFVMVLSLSAHSEDVCGLWLALVVGQSVLNLALNQLVRTAGRMKSVFVLRTQVL